MEIGTNGRPTPAPSIRVRALNTLPVRDGDYVLYWMVACRRPRWSFPLQHAAAHAKALGKPLVVFEPLRVGYRWASDRLHRFILDGMRDHRAYFRNKGVVYLPYVEPNHGDGRGLLAALAAGACLVVSDDYPCFFIPKMHKAAAQRIQTRLELVDGNGLLPMRATTKVFARAFDFRRFLQKTLPTHLDVPPVVDPLADMPSIPTAVLEGLPRRLQAWPTASEADLRGDTLGSMPLDHGVGPTDLRGGFIAGETRVTEFLDGAFDRYADERNHPDAGASSGFSPWLHFGHVSTHQIFQEIAANEGWSRESLGTKTGGAREGWWGMSRNAEAFLDELVTWREVGFNMCALNPNYDQYASLPEWARTTLEEHQADRREHLYTLEEFEEAKTHDAVWNAAQRELAQTGRLHNYLRMLWGKKILEWTPSARDALAIMVELNNKYAIDGRDPNSYSGIFWVLGRYDRAWGPERAVFGKIRYMSSANTLRKVRMNSYLARFGAQAALLD